MTLLATRQSALALAQSQRVADAITSTTGAPVELVPVVSLGDRSSRSLQEFAGAGVFVAAVRDAVLAGAADIAVHSLKDLPTAPHPDIALLAVPPRGPVHDVLVSPHGPLAELPPAARVGTGSPRRRAQLLRVRPDLRIVDIRGNVDTRLGMVEDGRLEAVVLAAAGLERLGVEHPHAHPLPTDQMLPAPGQGALAVECRGDRLAEFAELAAALDDPATRAAVTAERAALARLEAGCAAPMGALATVTHGNLALATTVLTDDEALVATESGPATEAETIGRRAADHLFDLGASRFLGEPVR